jgi:hypothetical protein
LAALRAGAGQNGYGLRISLAKFRSRMGPVREDRNVDNALAVVLQVWLAQNSPELTFRIEELHNSSDYWRVETIEWPLRLFPVRTLTTGALFFRTYVETRIPSGSGPQATRRDRIFR